MVELDFVQIQIFVVKHYSGKNKFPSHIIFKVSYFVFSVDQYEMLDMSRFSVTDWEAAGLTMQPHMHKQWARIWLNSGIC